MLEYEKFQEQQAKMMKMQEDYERQLQEMEESKEHALEELTEYYETKLQEATNKLEQVSHRADSALCLGIGGTVAPVVINVLIFRCWS